MQQQFQQSEGYIAIMFVVTFRVGRRRREMYCGHARPISWNTVIDFDFTTVTLTAAIEVN